MGTERASIVHPFNNNWNPSPLTWNESAVCFNRTSFQQQLKLLANLFCVLIILLQSYILSTTTETRQRLAEDRRLLLQSYILSTTTETVLSPAPYGVVDASIVHPFNNNWNDFQSAYSFSSPHCFNRTSFQQQLKLSDSSVIESTIIRFNRTSFQQQLKRSLRTSKIFLDIASIVHPFNNNWNISCGKGWSVHPCFNRTSFQQQLKHR